MLTWLATQRKPIPTISNPIPEKYYPGQIVTNLHCDLGNWQSDEPLQCYKDSFYFSWDYRTGATEHTSVDVPERPIGDYILSWGTPIGQIKMSVCRYIYWQLNGSVVYVLTCGKHFGPDTPVSYVMMSRASGPLEAWSGFTNK